MSRPYTPPVVEPDVETPASTAGRGCPWCFWFFAGTSVLVLAGIVYMSLIVLRFKEIFPSLGLKMLPPPTALTLLLFDHGLVLTVAAACVYGVIGYLMLSGKMRRAAGPASIGNLITLAVLGLSYFSLHMPIVEILRKLSGP